MLWKKVTYRDRNDGEIKSEWFQVEGSRNKNKLTVDKRSEIDTITFMKQDHVEYLGSHYYDERNQV